MVERRVGERRVDLVAQGDQDAATRVEELADRGDLPGIEPLDIGQHGHALPFQIIGAEGISPDDARLDRERLGTGRGEGRPQKVGLARQRLDPWLAVDQQDRQRGRHLDGPARLVVVGECIVASPVRRTVRACEPGSAIDVRNDSGISPPGGSGPTTWAVPGTAWPSIASSAVRVSGPGPAFETLVVIVIGRWGVINPP